MWGIGRRNDERRYLGMNERGATMVFVAVSLIGLLAMTAFSFDFGRVYVERRELQVGAEAAALAIARDCAQGACPADTFAEADVYADANARDGAAWIQGVDLDTTAQTVHVVTGNEDPDGNRNFDMTFGRVVGVDAYTVGAEATAAWGAPSSLNSALPLTFSKCEWQAYGGNGALVPGGSLHPREDVETLVKPPRGPTVWQNNLDAYAHRHLTTTVFFHGSQGAPECLESVSGQDLPGGFGWLDEAECEATLYEDDTAPIDPGASPSTGCTPTYLNDLLGTVQLLPYFDGYQETGSNALYDIAGFGAFYITGFNFGGQYKEDSLVHGTAPCTGEDRCIEGFLVDEWIVSGGGTVGGGNDFGLQIIALTG